METPPPFAEWRRRGHFAWKAAERMTVSSNRLAALRLYLLTVAATNLLWEAAHLPLYTLWQTGSASANMFAVAHCTLGDVLIALASLTLALLLVGHRDWPARRFTEVAVLTLGFGLGYTVFSEWLNVVVRRRWAYSSLMPIVSPFGFAIGISPLLQWIVVPILAFYLASRTRMNACTEVMPARLAQQHKER